MTFVSYPADLYQPARRGGTFRFSPYAVAVGCIAILYVGALVVVFLTAGGLDESAYDCSTIFCSPTDAVLITGIIAIPSTAIAAIFSVLALVVLHGMGGRLHPVAEGVLAALVGIGVSALGTAIVLAL